MARKQKVIYLGGGAGFSGTITDNIVLSPTPVTGWEINVAKGFNALELDTNATLSFSATPTVDGTYTVLGLQNTSASALTITLPGSPAVWSLDHGAYVTSFVLPAYGRAEIGFKWEEDDAIWVANSIPMSAAQVKTALGLHTVATSGSASDIDSGLLAVAQGGTGTATPGLVAGSNVTVTGTWPNQTIASSGGGGGSIFNVVSGGAPDTDYTGVDTISGGAPDTTY